MKNYEKVSISFMWLLLILNLNVAFGQGILSNYDQNPKVFVVEELSNTSDIFFDKNINGEKIFWTVVDQSGIKDNTQLFQITLSPDSQLVKVSKRIRLNNVYDLEGIVVHPIDHTFILADERAKDYNKEELDKRAALRRYTISGTEILSYALQEFTHQGNNGLEGLAIRLYESSGEIKIYAFREYMENEQNIPEIFVYKLVNYGFIPMGSFQIDDPFNVNQSGAYFDPKSGHLLVVSKTQRKILEIDPDSVENGKVKVIDSIDYRDFVNKHIRKKQDKYGIVEGITMDDDRNIYIILDNNDEEIGDGTSEALETSKRPRILMFSHKF